MKRIIVLLTMCMYITGNIYAELKYFLPRDNAVLSILDKKYHFDGDTIIDGKRYTKIYRQVCISDTECGDLSYYAAVREDTIAEKIYCIFAAYSGYPRYPEGTEVLLADFAVQPGDEVTVYSDWEPCRDLAFVESVDEVLVNGEYRKRINLSHESKWQEDDLADSWIEGIGSVIYGLFFPHTQLVIDAYDFPEFLCLHVGDILIYQNSFYNTCYMEPYDPWQGYEQCIQNCMQNNPDKSRSDCEFYCLYWHWNNIKETNRSDFNIYPTLTNDILNVVFDDGQYSYRIYDGQGKFTQSDVVTNNTIKVVSLKPGVYYILFYGEDNQPVYAGKFIKQ